MRFGAAALTAFGSVLGLVSECRATSYWLRIVGGNDLVDSKILRSNNTYSLGISLPPYNPADHFVRITPYPAPDIPSATNLTIVPTHPHPGPLAGHLALNGTNSPRSCSSSPEAFAFKLIQTWHPETEAGEVHLSAWTTTKRADDDGREWLRYGGEGIREGRWVAVRGATPFFGEEFWSPWWVGRGADLAGVEWVEIDVEVVVAQDGVNSRRQRRGGRRR